MDSGQHLNTYSGVRPHIGFSFRCAEIFHITKKIRSRYILWNDYSSVVLLPNVYNGKCRIKCFSQGMRKVAQFLIVNVHTPNPHYSAYYLTPVGNSLNHPNWLNFARNILKGLIRYSLYSTSKSSGLVNAKFSLYTIRIHMTYISLFSVELHSSGKS